MNTRNIRAIHGIQIFFHLVCAERELSYQRIGSTTQRTILVLHLQIIRFCWRIACFIAKIFILIHKLSTVPFNTISGKDILLNKLGRIAMHTVFLTLKAISCASAYLAQTSSNFCNPCGVGDNSTMSSA